MAKRRNPTETVNEAFARRMRHYRDRRQWTQKELADELSNGGWKVDRTQIARIESGDRGIALDEALMIAWALSVPPALLYLPLGDANEVSLTPELTMEPSRALQWVRGDTLPSVGIVRDPVAFVNSMGPWWAYDRHHDAVRNLSEARINLRDAETFEVGIEGARTRHMHALRNLAEIRHKLEADKLVLPALDEDTRADLARIES